ncbi:MAG TPA: CBS domain-containing protein [Thiopseudomonas sp.]|nr:CBS domain-containing protein [Thiopseudomonas sp.]
MKISEWLKIHPVKALTLPGDSSLEDAARMLLNDLQRRDLFIIDADGQLCGHLGFWHLATLLLAELHPTHSLRQVIERITLGCVADHMDDQVMCVGVDENIEELVYQHDLFQQHVERRVEDIPVIDEQRRLLGVIRLSDLLRNAINNTAHEGEEDTQ